MGIKNETRTIGEHEYTVYQLGAKEGREILRRLVKVLGASFDVVAREWGTGGFTSNLPAMARGAVAVVENLEGPDLVAFCDAFGKSSTVRLGEKNPKVADVFDLHFAGNYDEMVLWLVFALEVNYAGFFRGMLAKVQSASAVSPAPSP